MLRERTPLLGERFFSTMFMFAGVSRDSGSLKRCHAENTMLVRLDAPPFTARRLTSPPNAGFMPPAAYADLTEVSV